MRRRRDRGALLLCLIVLVWNMGALLYDTLPRSAPSSPAPVPAAPLPPPPCAGAAPVSTVRKEFLLGRRLDINKAPWSKITELPGISDKVAKAAVKIREERGPFRRPEDLLMVPGIKEKRLKKILPFLTGFHNN